MSEMIRAAKISADQKYRYTLRRTWDDDLWSLTFVMLNPSTADAYQDDATIRRCIRFAKDAGAGEILVVNLYAYRATQPSELWKTEDPVGPLNNWVLRTHTSQFVVAAWGAYAPDERVAEALGYLPEDIWCLGTTKMGHPRHPLYVRADQPFVKWERP